MLRMILFVIFASATSVWLLAGSPLSQRVTGIDSTPSEVFLDRVTDELMKEDPTAAATVTKHRENNEIKDLALASAVRDAEIRGGLPEIHSLLKPSSQTEIIPIEVRLAMLATDPSRFPVREDRERFLYAHGSVLDVLERTGDRDAADAYLTNLEGASQDPKLWRNTFDDAIALVLFEVVTDKDSRAYYEREKDQDWLEETLAQLAGMVETEADISDESPHIIADALEVAEKYHPYFKQSIVDHKFDASVYFLFGAYGDVIQHAVRNHGIPLNEVLEVVFANQDIFEQKYAQKSSQLELAARLAHIRNEKSSVWIAARGSALALRLNADVPGHAEAIFKKYRGDDIAILLYAGYESEIEYAADALVKFGDLAIYILSQYQDTPAFHEALTKPGIGPRLIPYVARFGDPGIDRLAENKAWLDKYFLPDGTPREKEWWTQIPGGEAANVARNIAKGRLNEWSELGWAALDVADAALLVASFGTSVAATTTVKQGGKTVFRKVGKDQAKRQAMRAGRNRATVIAGQGSRSSAKRETRSLLRLAAGRTTRVLRAVRDPVSKSWRMTLATVRIVKTPAEKVFTAARELNRTWKSVSPATRKIVYRSLLAVGLFVTITERTIPALPEIGEAAGQYVKDLVADTASGISEGLNNAIEALISQELGEMKLLIDWGVYLFVLMFLAGLTWSTRPVLKRNRHA